jgi:hypothetical protein
MQQKGQRGGGGAGSQRRERSCDPYTYSISRDRLVVRTLRCGRSNPGSNPGHGTFYNVTIKTVFKNKNNVC